jgi:hypothetical protein
MQVWNISGYQFLAYTNFQSVHDTYEGKADASFRGGHAAGQLDPVVMVAAMASVTKSLSIGITGSTTYIPVRSLFSQYKLPATDTTLAILACTNLGNIRSYNKRPNCLEYCYEL